MSLDKELAESLLSGSKDRFCYKKRLNSSIERMGYIGLLRRKIVIHGRLIIAHSTFNAQ